MLPYKKNNEIFFSNYKELLFINRTSFSPPSTNFNQSVTILPKPPLSKSKENIRSKIKLFTQSSIKNSFRKKDNNNIDISNTQ